MLYKYLICMLLPLVLITNIANSQNPTNKYVGIKIKVQHFEPNTPHLRCKIPKAYDDDIIIKVNDKYFTSIEEFKMNEELLDYSSGDTYTVFNERVKNLYHYKSKDHYQCDYNYISFEEVEIPKYYDFERNELNVTDSIRLEGDKELAVFIEEYNTAIKTKDNALLFTLISKNRFMYYNTPFRIEKEYKGISQVNTFIKHYIDMLNNSNKFIITIKDTDFSHSVAKDYHHKVWGFKVGDKLVSFGTNSQRTMAGANFKLRKNSGKWEIYEMFKLFFED